MCYNEREYRRKSTPESCIEIQFKGVKSMIKVGFIDYYLDEWHANNYVHMLHDYSNGEVEAVYAWLKSTARGRPHNGRMVRKIRSHPYDDAGGAHRKE